MPCPALTLWLNTLSPFLPSENASTCAAESSTSCVLQDMWALLLFWPLDMITASPDDKVTSHWITTGEFSPIFVARTRVDVKRACTRHGLFLPDCNISMVFAAILTKAEAHNTCRPQTSYSCRPDSRGWPLKQVSTSTVLADPDDTTNSSTNKERLWDTIQQRTPSQVLTGLRSWWFMLTKEDPLGGLSKAWALVPWNANPLTP